MKTQPPYTVLQRLLLGVLRITLWRPWLTVGLAFCLAALSWVYTARNLDFLTSQHDLISPEHPLIRLTDSLKPFDEQDSFLVVVQGRGAKQSLSFLRALVNELADQRDRYPGLLYRIDPERFRSHALLYADIADVERISEQVTENEGFLEILRSNPTLNTFFLGLNDKITSKMVDELFTGFLEDSTSVSRAGRGPDSTFLIEVLSDLESSLDGETDVRVSWEKFSGVHWDSEKEPGYFWSEDGARLFLFVTPAKAGKDFRRTAESLEHLRNVIQRLKTGFPGLDAGVTGQEALNADQMSVSLSDMKTATLLSVAGLSALLLFFWRNVRRPILEIAELLVALSWTFGLATLVVGHLNILSVVFAPLLLGLGIDYGIHWFARFEEKYRADPSAERAITRTHVELGPGIVLSGLCAAFSFLPLVLTGFRGLMELGLITGLGMILTTLTTICVLPALTHIAEHYLPPLPRRKQGGVGYFELGPGKARIVLVVGTVAFIMSIATAHGVKFDLNMLNLQPKGAESVIWEHRLTADAEHSALTASVLVPSLDEVRLKTAELESLPEVASVESVLSYLPEQQKDKLERLRKLEGRRALAPFPIPREVPDRQGLEEVLSKIRLKTAPDSDWDLSPLEATRMEEVKDRITRILDVLDGGEPRIMGARLAYFQQELFRGLSESLDLIRRASTADFMRIDDLPDEVLKRYVGSGPLYRIRIYPEGNVWNPERLDKFVTAVRQVAPDAAGDAVTLFVFTREFRRACIKAAFYSVGAIFLLLIFSLRDIVKSLFALVPLVVGTGWTLGLMRLLRLDFNLANSMFLPLIVGAGVEYGIIVVLAVRDSGGRGPTKGSLKGVVLAALTTTVGFGTLMISSHRGIHSLGLLAAVGSLCVMASAVFYLPALLNMPFGLRKRVPSG